MFCSAALASRTLKLTTRNSIPCHFDDEQENMLFCSAALASRTLKLTTDEIPDISC
jgi:hypothetical protein